MPEVMCCPECGATAFTQKRVALIAYTVEVYANGGECDTAESIEDGGDRDGPLVCDCGEEFESYSELSTVDAYNAADADPCAWCGYSDCDLDCNEPEED